MDHKEKYWLEMAKYDLETAKVMLDSGRYLYLGFMAHQVIEKMLKAFYVYTKQNSPPYSHNLVLLAEKTGLYEQFTEEQKDFLDMLAPLNIEARYPTHKEKLMKSLNKERCKQIFTETKRMYAWIKEKLQK